MELPDSRANFVNESKEFCDDQQVNNTNDSNVSEPESTDQRNYGNDCQGSHSRYRKFAPDQRTNRRSSFKMDDRHTSVIQGRIFIRGIPEGATNERIADFFQHYGAVKDANVPSSPNGRNRGYCFVTFHDQKIADDLIGKKNIKYDGQYDLSISSAIKKHNSYTSNTLGNDNRGRYRDSSDGFNKRMSANFYDFPNAPPAPQAQAFQYFQPQPRPAFPALRSTVSPYAAPPQMIVTAPDSQLPMPTNTPQIVDSNTKQPPNSMQCDDSDGYGGVNQAATPMKPLPPAQYQDAQFQTQFPSPQFQPPFANLQQPAFGPTFHVNNPVHLCNPYQFTYVLDQNGQPTVPAPPMPPPPPNAQPQFPMYQQSVQQPMQAFPQQPQQQQMQAFPQQQQAPLQQQQMPSNTMDCQAVAHTPALSTTIPPPQQQQNPVQQPTQSGNSNVNGSTRAARVPSSGACQMMIPPMENGSDGKDLAHFKLPVQSNTPQQVIDSNPPMTIQNEDGDGYTMQASGTPMKQPQFQEPAFQPIIQNPPFQPQFSNPAAFQQFPSPPQFQPPFFNGGSMAQPGYLPTYHVNNPNQFYSPPYAFPVDPAAVAAAQIQNMPPMAQQVPPPPPFAPQQFPIYHPIPQIYPPTQQIPTAFDCQGVSHAPALSSTISHSLPPPSSSSQQAQSSASRSNHNSGNSSSVNGKSRRTSGANTNHIPLSTLKNVNEAKELPHFKPMFDQAAVLSANSQANEQNRGDNQNHPSGETTTTTGTMTNAARNQTGQRFDSSQSYNSGYGNNNSNNYKPMRGSKFNATPGNNDNRRK